MDCANRDITWRYAPRHWHFPWGTMLWEAWPITEPGPPFNNQLFLGYDEYQMQKHLPKEGFGDCTKGWARIDGTYAEISGTIPMPPFKKPGVPEAGILPSTDTDPMIDMGGHGRRHAISVEWNCCN